MPGARDGTCDHVGVEIEKGGRRIGLPAIGGAGHGHLSAINAKAVSSQDDNVPVKEIATGIKSKR